MEQRAEPPSWLPEGGQPRTGAAADLRNPEADEATAGTTDGDTGYNFSGSTSYPESEDTTFGQTGTTAGGYSYDPSPATDATSAVPPYPASLTEPAGSTSGTSSSGTSLPGTGAGPGSSGTGRARHVQEPGVRGQLVGREGRRP